METATAPARRSVAARTMAEAFRLTAEDYGDRVAVRTKDDEVRLTWAQLRDRVDALAGGLAKLGVRRGDRVALMLDNRPEFHIADLAAMTLGATPFSLYQTLAPEQVEYVLSDAGAKVAIVQRSYLERLAESQVETVIVLDGQAPGTVPWEEVEGADPEFDVEAAWRAVEPDDLLTLIYTSGTTGPPKGVQLEHRNLLAAVTSIEQI